MVSHNGDEDNLPIIGSVICLEISEGYRTTSCMSQKARTFITESDVSLRDFRRKVGRMEEKRRVAEKDEHKGAVAF